MQNGRCEPFTAVVQDFLTAALLDTVQVTSCSVWRDAKVSVFMLAWVNNATHRRGRKNALLADLPISKLFSRALHISHFCAQ
ncbi:hypothetical protein [Prosthecobacter sp.]|uniref:hypothetical protein n=1 Tax=Prosthecobacter sp. TaxID=1965333 RepID=UPI003782DA87